MSKVVAIAGLGDDAAPATPAPTTMVMWSIVVGTTIGIFIGTLLLNPSKKRS